MATLTDGVFKFTQIGSTQTCSVEKNGTPIGSIVIPSSVAMGDKTYSVTRLIDFSDLTSVTSVTIPDSVTSLGDYAFIRSTLLRSITVAANNANYSNDSQGILYNKNKTTLVACPSGLTSITILNSVTRINSSSFYGSTIQSINIPDSVTSIGNQAFNSCRNLTSITIGTGVKSIGESAFEACGGLASIILPNSLTSIADGAFFHCSGLTSVTIGTGVTSIDNNAFLYCSGLISVTIPNSVTSIGIRAFEGCALTSIIIPSSVTSIGSCAFYDCPNLSIMYFLGLSIPNLTTIFGTTLTEHWDVISIKQDKCVYQPGTSASDITRLLTVFNVVEENFLACFLEDTEILTSRGYVKIQDLNIGDKVKTLNDGYKKISMIGKKTIINNYNENDLANCVYKLSKDKYKELREDLYITGRHPILVAEENIKNTIELKYLKWRNHKTDGLYRLLSYKNPKAVPLTTTVEATIWNFVLQRTSKNNNYGIYANGLLTESMSENSYIKYSGLS